MLHSISANLVDRARCISCQNLSFGESHVGILFRFYALTVMVNSLGQILFTVGCFLVVSLARSLNKALRHHIIS